MVAKIITFIACFMCAIPFLIISHYWKDGPDPINFWSGDESLKTKVKNIKEYNREMAQLYQKVWIVFLTTGIIAFLSEFVAVILIGVECTVGIYVVYRIYKKILLKYS